MKPLTPRSLRSIRVWPGVHEPIPVRRTPAQEPALLHRLRPHRRQCPMPRPHHLVFRLRPQRRDQRVVHRVGGVHRPVHLRKPHLNPVTCERLGHRQELARGEGTLELPHDPPRRMAVADRAPRPAAPPPVDAAPTAPPATSPRRRTRPRPRRARRSPTSRSPPATPATTPDPDSPPSRFAHRTRTTHSAPPQPPARRHTDGVSLGSQPTHGEHPDHQSRRACSPRHQNSHPACLRSAATTEAPTACRGPTAWTRWNAASVPGSRLEMADWGN